MADFVVHGIPGSPYVRAALLALEEKGAPYRLAAMSFASMKTPEHLAHNPFGRIPMLDHGEFRLYETQAILRYIDDVVPAPPFQPATAEARARVNQLVGITDFYVSRQISAAISRERIIRPLLFGAVPNEEQIAAALPEAQICVNAIEALMGDGAFLIGDALSIADLMLAPHISYFAMTPEGKAMLGTGKLGRWIARMDARPSLQRTTLDKMREKLPKAA